MKRSKGYFCKQSDVFEEAELKDKDRFIYEVLRVGKYNQKAKWRLILKLTLRDDDSLWWLPRGG